MPKIEEFGVVPGSPLARLLAQLGRSDRRLLLAAVQAAPGKRREKMERDLKKRLRAKGILD